MNLHSGVGIPGGVAYDDQRSRGGRLLCSLLLGCALGIPTGWLLATLSALPGYLGLFFCMLFGTLIGAVMYRVSSSVKPVSRGWLWLLGLFVGLVVWTTSVIGEYYNVRGYSIYRYGDQGFNWYPIEGDAEKAVRETYAYRSFAPEEKSLLRQTTQQAFLDELAKKYPPGGFTGFIHWARSKEDIHLPRPFAKTESSEVFHLRQQGLTWIIRVLLSLILTTTTIQAQVLGLAPRRAKPTQPQTTDPLGSP